MTTSNEAQGTVDHDARLANRATLLTLASLVCLVVAVMAMPLTFQRTEAAMPRVAASTPLALGVGAGFMARAARAQLRVLRNERESAQ